MDAVTYMKEKHRLTESCGICCSECRLHPTEGEYCSELEYNYPERAVEIIEQWGKEVPQETYRSVFLKAFPNANMDKICVEEIFGEHLNCSCTSPCKDCWNEPYNESEKANE